MSYKKIQSSLNVILSEIRKFNRFHKNILYTKFKDKYNKKLWFIMLYFSQIELTKNIQTALINKNPVIVPILVRSSLDLLIQMGMCNNDFRSLVAHFKKTAKTDFQNYKKVLSETNPKELSRTQLIDIINFLDSNPLNDKKLASYSIKKIQEAEKRKIAKLEKNLDLSYAALSDHVHNNYSILAQRHLIQQNSFYKILGCKKIDKTTIYYSVYTLIQVLFGTYIELIKCIHLPRNHNLESLFLSLQTTRAALDTYLDNKEKLQQ